MTLFTRSCEPLPIEASEGPFEASEGSYVFDMVTVIRLPHRPHETA